MIKLTSLCLAATVVSLGLVCAHALAAGTPPVPENSMADDLVPASRTAAVPASATAVPAALQARRRDHENRRAQALLGQVDEHVTALLPYAALANEVYCNAIYERQGDSGAALPADLDCRRDGHAQRHGWTWLESYPNGRIGPDDYRGMRFAVYYRDHGPEEPVDIGVGFRGTDFKSAADWHSNLRWFLPGRDQYDVLGDIVPAVIEASKAAVLKAIGRPVNHWHIVATGHSLGGGLAQLFAYKSDEVRGAVAFDPSPVTGFHGCVQDTEVNCNVPVWRVYEQGEVLSYVRAFTRLFYPLSENITELEFNLMGGNVIANHSMPRFYSSLSEHHRQLPVAAQKLGANLFQGNPDCSCSRDRRPKLYAAAVLQWCEQLMARREEPTLAAWGEFGPTLPPALAQPVTRSSQAP